MKVDSREAIAEAILSWPLALGIETSYVQDVLSHFTDAEAHPVWVKAAMSEQ